MEKKKGFTLIELLAVILILGIIALIAIPTVTNIIKDSKKSAFKTSVQNVVKAIETNCQLEQMKGASITKSYDLENAEDIKKINIKGDLPSSGTITVDDSCNIMTLKNVTDGLFTAIINALGNIEVEDEKNGTEVLYTCMRATDLHTATVCPYDSCNDDQFAFYTYGKLGTKGELKSGDAFDCDVNNDGIYDSETERFYYVSDYYDTKTQTFDEDKVTLIYYSNVFAGEPYKEARLIAYNSDVYEGPESSLLHLPSMTEWDNPKLITGEERNLIAEEKQLSTSGGMIITSFSYSNYAARFLTYRELWEACGSDSLDECTYLMENCNDSSGTYGYYLENPLLNNSTKVFTVMGIHHEVDAYEGIGNLNAGVRPAITLDKKDIQN